LGENIKQFDFSRDSRSIFSVSKQSQSNTEKINHVSVFQYNTRENCNPVCCVLIELKSYVAEFTSPVNESDDDVFDIDVLMQVGTGTKE
jgi:hypothetical protein